MQSKKSFNILIATCTVLCLSVLGALVLKKNTNKKVSKEESGDVVVVSNDFNDYDININGNERETLVYYMDDKMYLVPVMKEISWPEDKSIAKETISHLIKDDANNMDAIALTPTIPENTAIKSVNIKDGLCTVVFDENFLRYDSKKEEEAIVKSIVYTLTEFETIEKVKISVNNVSNLNYGFDITKPINREDINFIGEDKSGNKMIVYYKSTVNGYDEYFLPVTVNTEELTKEVAIEKLGNIDDNGGLYATLPNNIVVSSVTITDGVAIVGLSDGLVELEEIYDIEEAQNSIAFTLRDNFNVEVNQVIITSVGEESIGATYTQEVVPTFLNINK